MRQRLTVPALGLALVALLVPACAGGDDGAATGGSRPSETTTTAASGPGASATTATTDPAIRIVLLAGRLNVGGNALVFGAPQSQVSSYLGRALGPPRQEQDQTCDAGELRSLEWAGITAYVGAEGLSGWYAQGPTYATDGGIRIGSAQSALQSAYPTAAITETTLGTEFSVEAEPSVGLSGVLEDGKVSALWSGATCIAR